MNDNVPSLLQYLLDQYLAEHKEIENPDVKRIVDDFVAWGNGFLKSMPPVSVGYSTGGLRLGFADHTEVDFFPSPDEVGNTQDTDAIQAIRPRGGRRSTGTLPDAGAMQATRPHQAKKPHYVIETGNHPPTPPKV